MKNNVWRVLMWMVLFSATLTSCVDGIDNPAGGSEETSTGDDAADLMAYKVTQTVVNDNGKSTKTVNLRYYDDMPHVAYIAVSDFQNLLVPDKSIKVSRTDASQYQLVTSKGETATVNTAEERMTFDDFMSFVSLTTPDADGFIDADILYYVRDMPAKLTPTTASVTFNLKKYGIDLRGDGKMVYVPLTTLADIYTDIGGNRVLFNGEKIILADFNTAPLTIDEAFFMKPYETTERPADLIAYSYGELCFAIDHFYGRPGRNAIDDIIQEQGLDKALDEKYRTLLKSTKMDEYIFGLEYLGVLLADGHTHLSPSHNIFLVGMTDNSKLAEFMKKFVSAFADRYPKESKAASKNINNDDGRELAVQARLKLFDSDLYAKIGNTMYCIFDDFGPADYESWAEYYKGTGPLPEFNPVYKGDICVIVEALDKAAADPEVKNFVLDLTCNNGGDANILLAITNLFAGKNSFTFENVLTNQRGVRTMLIDGNFDRVFDDKDNAPRYPQLNIAIMTSHYAFSSGNLLPSLMKDYGYLIIGEKSGGGSCSIQHMCTAEGFCYILSTSRTRLTNKAGENIDRGVEPHIALEVVPAKGKDEYGAEVEYSDFSAFYSPSVGDQISAWYADK